MRAGVPNTLLPGSIIGVMASGGNLGLSLAALAALATRYGSSATDLGAELLAAFCALTLPLAVLALYGSIRTKPFLLFLSFALSLPFSFYFWCFMTGSIYKYRGIFDLLYLVSGIALSLSLKARERKS
ncbi:hypothetical protein [Ammonifex thiophilus]|uniref:Uncharacterized protein n=1 Tax=Ammonifex thiophilus TaxID=444093 RepID=A0A3D8P4G8_9THEO|nr:hypothetical protein [Ammonifex thiophilus]RDV84003.1 hypothetical protein DXX99_03995 [Ammonifex thiophilus]